VGFLDDVNKKLAPADETAQNKPDSGPGIDAGVTPGSSSDAPADVVNQQTDAQTADLPPAAEAVVEPVVEPELAEPVLEEPVLTEPVAAEMRSSASEVVVEPGDTLRGIAAQYGVDLEELIAVNARTVPNPDHIYPGQVLHLP